MLCYLLAGSRKCVLFWSGKTAKSCIKGESGDLMYMQTIWWHLCIKCLQIECKVVKIHNLPDFWSEFTSRYASLYFCCAIEQNDNELLTLEIIHRYVELLDKYFGSVSIEIVYILSMANKMYSDSHWVWFLCDFLV